MIELLPARNSYKKLFLIQSKINHWKNNLRLDITEYLGTKGSWSCSFDLGIAVLVLQKCKTKSNTVNILTRTRPRPPHKADKGPIPIVVHS